MPQPLAVERPPLCVDLFCGLGGFSSGFIEEGYFCVGFDIERHEYGEERYPGHLVIQDVLTVHGSQFRNAAVIVASPPCQRYSYMAMPWTRAKDQARAIRADETGGELEKLNALFNACFRIQREACEAAGRHIPLIVENVKGAQPWVGRSRWNFGSFHLWGDVPALMPIAVKVRKNSGGGSSFAIGSPGQTVTGQNPVHELSGVKAPDMNWSDQAKRGQDFTRLAGNEAIKNRDTEGYDRSHPNAFGWKIPRTSRKSNSRKAASAMIAKIPPTLSRHFARTFKP